MVIEHVNFLQRQVIQSLNGLSDDNLRFFTRNDSAFYETLRKQRGKCWQVGYKQNIVRRIDSLDGQYLIDADYDIDECNDEIAKLFGVFEWWRYW